MEAPQSEAPCSSGGVAELAFAGGQARRILSLSELLEAVTTFSGASPCPSKLPVACKDIVASLLGQTTILPPLPLCILLHRNHVFVAQIQARHAHQLPRRNRR